MANENGQAPDPVTAELQANPFRFDFFRAVRLIENRFRNYPRIGRTLSPHQDAVRFGQNPSMAFAPSTLESLEASGPGKPPRLNVHFFGLLGPNGPMPAHITEYARDRMRNLRDSTLAEFFDVFHHRMLSFFYRAWASNQKAADFDRPEESRFAGYIGSFFGIGERSLRNRDEIPDVAKLHFAGRLSAQTRNAEGLEAILGDFFNAPVEIETFRGHWLTLPEEYRCRLGMSPESASLGINSIAGARIWDVQNRFRARFGPIPFAVFQRLLPNGDAFARVKCWIKNYTSERFWWDLQLVLKRDEVPPTQLGGGSLLGWTCWLKTKPFQRDADDLVIEPTN